MRREMLEDKHRDIKDIKKGYDRISKTYDRYSETFEGKVDEYLGWGRLNSYLPTDKSAKILDAGGGTGRWALPLAKMGYQVELCDLSPGMLDVAREKLRREGILEKVEIREANIASLPYQDKSFDFILCVGHPFSLADSLRAAKELTRVMRRGGKIFVDAASRYWAAVHKKNPEIALKLIKSEMNCAYDSHGDWCRIFSPKELKELFERNGIKVIRIYSYFTDSIPEEIRKPEVWDDKFFFQVAEVIECLSEEPSIQGIGSSLTLVGEKR